MKKFTIATCGGIGVIISLIVGIFMFWHFAGHAYYAFFSPEKFDQTKFMVSATVLVVSILNNH